MKTIDKYCQEYREWIRVYRSNQFTAGNGAQGDPATASLMGVQLMKQSAVNPPNLDDLNGGETDYLFEDTSE
jgi:hypothetical protein